MGQWHDRTLLVARPYDLRLPKFIITEATAPLRDGLGALARLAWPHSAKATQVCGAFAPPLGARARPCVRMMGVACPRPSTWCSRTNYWKVRAPAPL
ncbi:hypothetical protein PIB30_036297 [Stylosanthes scabra]|uniref:Uncharacterized protein n=1 Tax=Stylosanthes scabra TaxID=79078 RepID=A0ABU6RDL9_9FABA|nr:hypothetical protein [Stylosanthes scabra]